MPPDSCTFPTEEIIVAQNFDFAPKFPENWAFLPQILHFWTKISRQKEKFSIGKNQWGGAAPPATTPLVIITRAEEAACRVTVSCDKVSSTFVSISLYFFVGLRLSL